VRTLASWTRSRRSARSRSQRRAHECEGGAAASSS
jgi:hypothetical protein